MFLALVSVAQCSAPPPNPVMPTFDRARRLCCDPAVRPGTNGVADGETAYACCPATGLWVFQDASGKFPDCPAGATGKQCCLQHACEAGKVPLWERKSAECVCVASERPGMCPRPTAALSCSGAVCEADEDCAMGEKCCQNGACGDTQRRCVASCEAVRCTVHSGNLQCAAEPKLVFDERGCLERCDQQCCVEGTAEQQGSVRCVCQGGEWNCKNRPARTATCVAGDRQQTEQSSCRCNRRGEWVCSTLVAAECKEGQTKPFGNCRTCQCSKRGIWRCHIDNTPCPAPECRAGEAKKRGCKRCSCSEQGKWICEQRACGPPNLPCREGDYFTQDYVRYVCDADSTWHAQNSGRSVVAAAECGPADVKTAGCAPCACVGGVWQCPDTSSCPPVPACNAGETVQLQCNTCRCSKSGTWNCGNRVCPPSPTVCAEGDTKSAGDGCNTLTCRGNTWVSSANVCSGQCAEGATKKIRCNTCTCSGGAWSCTKTKCSPCSSLVCSVGEVAQFTPGRLCPKGQACQPCSCVASVAANSTTSSN